MGALIGKGYDLIYQYEWLVIMSIIIYKDVLSLIDWVIVSANKVVVIISPNGFIKCK